MKFDIETAKLKAQRGGTYIVGLKVVTTEIAETVLQTIRKDIMILPEITRFIINENTIEVTYKNATLYVFYFTNQTVFDDVIKELPKFEIDILNENI